MQQNDQMEPRTVAAVQKAVEQLNEQWQRKLFQYKNDLELRKWAVDAAIRGQCSSIGPAAQTLYEFLTGAFDEQSNPEA